MPNYRLIVSTGKLYSDDWIILEIHEHPSKEQLRKIQRNNNYYIGRKIRGYTIENVQIVEWK